MYRWTGFKNDRMSHSHQLMIIQNIFLIHLRLMTFNSEKIKNLLLYEKSRYQIIKSNTSSSAPWWRAFGYPFDGFFHDNPGLSIAFFEIKCKCLT